MSKTNPTLLIRELILAKEAEQAEQEKIVREQFLITYESLKPINLLKSTITQALHSPDIRDGFTNALLGRASGFAIKQLIQFESNNPFLKLSATAAELIVRGQVIQNAEEIKSIGAILFRKLSEYATAPANTPEE